MGPPHLTWMGPPRRRRLPSCGWSCVCFRTCRSLVSPRGESTGGSSSRCGHEDRSGGCKIHPVSHSLLGQADGACTSIMSRLRCPIFRWLKVKVTPPCTAKGSHQRASAENLIVGHFIWGFQPLAPGPNPADPAPRLPKSHCVPTPQRIKPYKGTNHPNPSIQPRALGAGLPVCGSPSWAPGGGSPDASGRGCSG